MADLHDGDSASQGGDPDPRDRLTTCPRCGYDLSGVVAAWRESCPMVGTCSECGLGLDWGETLNPMLRMPKWFVENRKSVAWRGAMRTLPRALLPWRFWGAVRMSFPVAPRRIALFLLLLAACFYATAGVAAALNVYEQRTFPWHAGEIGDYDELVALFLPFVYVGSPSFGGNLIFNGWTAAAGVWFLFVPVAFFLLPTTLRRAKVLPRHLGRAAAYGLVGLVLLLDAHLALWVGVEALYTKWGRAGWPWLGVYSWRLVRPEWFYPAGSALWLFIWWHAATRRYLRLPNAGAVALALVLLAGLATLLVVASLQLAGATTMLDAWLVPYHPYW